MTRAERRVRYLSICAGIEAACVAWHDLGWQCVGVSEIEPFACSVLQQRFPNVRNYGDMTRYREWEIEDGAVELLVGGTPCQSFSVAGLRRGLDDPRGNLALVYLGMVDRYRPKWVVWENVPGVLSVDGGRAFGSFLGGLAQLGYGFSWRVLDAQYTRVDGYERAVPQRRRRVFVVGRAGGDWRAPARVLLEPQSMRGDSSTSGKARKEAAAGTDARARASRAHGQVLAATANGRSCEGVAGTLTKKETINHYTTVVATVATCDEAPAAGTNARDRADRAVICREDVSATVTSKWAKGTGGYAGAEHMNLIAVTVADPITANEQRTYSHEGKNFRLRNVVPVDADSGTTSMVRRLTPRECERLQGFPDDWTLVQYRGKPAKDGPRYRAIGNSMAVNVMRWIGRRIQSNEGEP